MKNHLIRKVGFEWTPKLDPHWKLEHVAYKVNMESNSDLSLWPRTILTRVSEILMAWTSWSRTWTTRTKTTTSRKPQKCSCKPIQGQSKTTKTYFSQLIHKNFSYRRKNLDRYWTTRLFVTDYSVSKKLIRLLRHGSLSPEDDGAIEFWRIKDYLRNDFESSQHWSDEMWKSIMAIGWRKKENISVLYWFFKRNSLLPSSSRSFRTQSHWSFIIGQCLDSGPLPQVHLSRWMCNQYTFHHQFRIDTGMSNFWAKVRQYSFCLWILWIRITKILRRSTWKHRVLHGTCIQHGRNTVYWVDIKLAQKKGLKFHQTRSNAIILHETLPAYCIPKVVRMETGEVIYEKVSASPRSPPKISLRNDWMKELGSEVARQAEDKQRIQPNQTQIQFIGTGRPVGTTNVPYCHMQLWNKPKILVFLSSWRRSRVTLIDKIFKPIYNKRTPTTHWVKKSKNMIQDMGNVELFELFETDLKTQCKECFLYWNQGIIYCTCGHLLKESEASRGILQWTLDLLSIPNYVIKKVRPQGNRHGKTEEKLKQHIAHNFEKEMHQERFWRDSRPLPKRLNILWIATQHWSNWRGTHPDGQRRAERFHLSNDGRWVL